MITMNTDDPQQSGPDLLGQIIIVLQRPRDVVNIGGVVRGMKNMGLRQLRLVSPVAFSSEQITGIAHRSDDLLAAMRTYDQLDAALADAIYVVGTTARHRETHPLRGDPRTLATELLARARHGPVALLFGPEDKGLDNTALDRCDTMVSLPTDEAYTSLNLAQAALLLMYELRMAATGPIPPLSHTSPATSTQLETLFSAVERALRAIAFFKGSRDESTMRSLRLLTRRASLGRHEAALLTAISYEVVHFLRRKGIHSPEDTEGTQ